MVARSKWKTSTLFCDTDADTDCATDTDIDTDGEMIFDSKIKVLVEQWDTIHS